MELRQMGLRLVLVCISLAAVGVLARLTAEGPRRGGQTGLAGSGGIVTISAEARADGWEQDRRTTQDSSGAGQNECYIAANPIDRDNAIVVSKDYREDVHNYIDATTDGGVTWLEQPFPPTDPEAPYNTDPAVFFNREGRAYIIWTAYLDFPHGGIYVAWSDDKGRTWSPAVQVTPPSGHFDDKPWLVFDETGGQYDGRMYAFWTRFGNAEIYAAYSSDSGLTWSAPVQASNGKWASNDDGAQPVILPTGEVLLIFLSNSTSKDMGTFVLTSSTDGGASFTPDEPKVDVQQPPYSLPDEHWRIFTYQSLVRDPVRGWLTMIWGDYRDGATNGIDILLSRSTDDGATWSAPARLNDDPPGLVRDQWFPSLTVSTDGRLTALWLDRRDDLKNRLYYPYSRSSTDGGLTWLPSVRVGSAASDPNLNIPPGADGIGDYIGIASGPGLAWAAWVDVRNGDQDIYSAREIFTSQASPSPEVSPSATPSPSPTVSPTATPCTITFRDVPPDAYFYEPVRALYCRGAISGYGDSTFRPWNSTTRSQLTKVITLAEGWLLVDPPQATFEDVPLGSTFFRYVETAFAHSIVAGYPCGGPGEACDPESRPYFRPGAAVTRGQAVKMIVLAEGWELLNPATPTYSDVVPGSPFYEYIETATAHAIIAGYPCGGPREPCDPQSRPYYRAGNPTARGQVAKIVYEATR